VKDDFVYLRHMLDAISKIEEYTAGMDEPAFLSDDKTKDSVVRQLEVVGMAANQVSRPFQTAHSSLPWREIVGMRNKVAHDYLGVDFRQVWKTVKHDLPPLKAALASAITGKK